MTKDEKQKEIAKIRAELAQLDKDIEDAKSLNPFYFFIPNGDTPSLEGKEILNKYLKPKDIPTVFDSQADVFKSDSNILFVSGGNQSGKSVTCCIYTFLYVTRTLPESLKGIYNEELFPEPGKFVRVRVVGVDNKQLKNVVIPAYKQWCPREFLDGGVWKNNYYSETKVLTLRKDGVEYGSIEFMTNEQDVDSFQGSPLDLLVYDEEPKEKIHRENLLRFTTAKRLQVLFGMTPTKGLSWTIKYTRGVKDDSGNKVQAFKLLPINNQKANLGVLDSILSQIDNYEELRMRLLGEFVSLSGLVYPSFNRTKHVIEPFPIDYTQHVVNRGLDPHQVTPTAVVWLAIDREGICYIIDCYFAKNDNVQDLKDAIYERSRGYRIGYSVADRSCDVSIHILDGINVYDLLKTGKNAMVGLKKSQKYMGSICSGVDKIRELLKNNMLYIFDTPNNQQLIESMMSLERERFANEDDKGEKDKIKEGRHHMHAAMRYVFQFNPRWYAIQSPPVNTRDDVDADFGY